MNKNNDYIWIFGENVSETANNNSFYFWKHVLNKKDDIKKYMVLKRNKNNKKIYKKLSKEEKKFIIWRNSIKHFVKYLKADMYFVTLSYRDIRPEKFLFKNFDLKIKKPLVYLQHGTLGMKKINYGGRTYNNNLFRFLYYNKDIKQTLVEENEFRDYQLYYGEFHPRYKELVSKNRKSQNNEKNQILWFLTWREYKPNSVENKIFIKTINNVLINKKLNEYLSKSNTKLRICIHQLYEIQKDAFMSNVNSSNIEIVYANQTDIMEEMVNSKLLITDYSSLGFDFTVLKKPVILFQPDLENYMEKREFYCSIDELKENNIESSKKLVEKIINEKYEINQFFKSRIKEDIDFDYLEQGKHIDKMYDYFKKIQENMITFIGYNFHGVGGTVSATRALAEGLLEKGYMVQLLSLKVVGKAKKFPCALNTQYIYHTKSKRSIIERIRRLLHNGPKNYRYFMHDENKAYMKPFVGYDLTKILSKIKSKTVISTRESVHLFLNEAKSEKIKNKIYFFHCTTDLVENIFPGIVNELKKINLSKAVFVSEKNREQYIEKFNYNNYEKSMVIGNALEKKNVIEFDEIEAVEKKEKYCGIYLLRLSKDRIKDLENVIEFGKYLKENNIKNIVIDVYGDGDYVEKFIDILIENELLEYIHYKGKTEAPTERIREHDALIDFSLNHSFGMTYIEGILNGKKVYCMKNTGSLEVMGDIPNTYIESHEDLVNKINNLPNITKEELQQNYTKIEEKYSREKISEKFAQFLK